MLSVCLILFRVTFSFADGNEVCKLLRDYVISRIEVILRGRQEQENKQDLCILTLSIYDTLQFSNEMSKLTLE